MTQGTELKHFIHPCILPQENVHSHVDRQNGQESVYEEPLQESAYDEPLLSESESDYDYPQSNRKYFLKRIR